MNVLIVDNGSRHTDKIEKFFDSKGWSVKRLSFDDPAIHETTEDTLAVLSGGGKMSVIGHLDEFRNEIDFVRNFGGPVIGICLGFELIAHANGTWLSKLDERVEGVKEISATEAGESLDLPPTTNVYEGHRWSVKDVDGPLEALARSDSGVEILAHTEKPQFGTQFHPEVGDGNDGEKILHILVDKALSAARSTSVI